MRKGVNCIAVTDHNEIEGAFVIQKLARERAPGKLKVVIGEEVKTAEGEIIGLFLKELVPRGMSPEDTVRAIHAQGGLAVIPHPYDIFRRSVLTDDAIERVKHDRRRDRGLQLPQHPRQARPEGARHWRRRRRQADDAGHGLALALGARRRLRWRWTTSRRRRSCCSRCAAGASWRPPLAADGALDQHLREDPLAPRPEANVRFAATRRSANAQWTRRSTILKRSNKQTMQTPPQSRGPIAVWA